MSDPGRDDPGRDDPGRDDPGRDDPVVGADPAAGGAPLPLAGAAGPVVPRARHLFVARVVEQVALGLASLLLAGRLGPEAFAPVSVLLVVNSFAIVASDFGVGLAVMRQPAGVQASLGSLHLLRWVNVALAVAAIAVGALVGGTVGWIVALSGPIWATSAEAFVRKSAAMRLMEARSVAIAEIDGAVAFLAVVGVALVVPDQALVLTGLACVAKHVVDAAAVRGWSELFAAGADRIRPLEVWGTQLLAFGIGNVDFLVVGAFFPATTFSSYVVAWRVATLAPAQVAKVAMRVSLVGFAENADSRQELHDRYMRNLFLFGGGAAVLTAAGAFLLPTLLGPEWDQTTMIVVVLALAVPFRVVLGISGTLALGSDGARRLLVLEVARLVASTLVFVGAASLGFAPFVAAVAVVNIASAATYDWDLSRAAGLHPTRHLPWSALVAGALAAWASTFVLPPG